MRIAIDVDGVLRNIMKKVIHRYNIKYTQSVHEHHIKNWHFAEHFPLHEGDIYHDAFYINAQDTFEESPPYDGAIEFMKKLAVKHDVWIVTNQYHNNEIHTLKWLYNHKIPYHSIVFTSDKHIVNCDVLIDDSIGNLENFINSGKRAICMGRPWNINYAGNRATSFDELFNML